jgi:hypothetical protein
MFFFIDILWMAKILSNFVEVLNGSDGQQNDNLTYRLKVRIEISFSQTVPDLSWPSLIQLNVLSAFKLPMWLLQLH